MKRTALILAAVAAAVALGWFFGQRSHSHGEASGGGGGRKVSFYQSPMHPWIKSEKPGNCTICGMKLSPVFEGEKGFDIEGNVVTLSPQAIQVVGVQTEEAGLHPIERTLAFAGRMEAPETRQRVISAYVDGRIEKLFVNFTGAEVEAGRPLAVLYSPALLTAEREYQTALSRANPGAERERLVEGARTRLRRLGLSDEQIAALGARESQGAATEILAPMSGTVVSRAVLEGQYVKEGDKLFEIADLSQMWFRFDVYEQDLPLIRTGQVVRVSSPALGAKVFEGPVTFIDPTLNQQTRSARVRVELNNPVIEEGGASRRALYNGLFATGQITFRSDPVLAVSRGAVIDPGDQPRVFVDQGGGAYENRPVTLGAVGQRYIEVRDGLSAGERVVTAGNLLLDAQAQINNTGSAHSHGPVEGAPGPAQPLAAAEISGEQNVVAAEFFTAASEVAAGLAADDLGAFNQSIGAVPSKAARLQEAFAAAPHLSELAAKVAGAARFTPAANLVLARTQFLPFSMALAEFAQALRKHGVAIPAKVYKCPMYPKLGQTAFWVQAQGPLRNPFFGSEMLECGVEVK